MLLFTCGISSNEILKLRVLVLLRYIVRVDRLYEDIEESIRNKSIHVDFDLSKLPLVISRVSALLGPLVRILCSTS